MNNAEKFQEVFGYYATEMWAKPEAEFLDWINAEYNTTIKNNERTGKWIVSGMEDDGRYMGSRWYACDQCGRAGDIGDNFCPNCGADMRGEK